MTAIYTWDIFSSLDGFGSHTGDWGGYWGKQGPELLARRAALTNTPQRMIFGANTYRDFAEMFDPDKPDPEGLDACFLPIAATVASPRLRPEPNGLQLSILISCCRWKSRLSRCWKLGWSSIWFTTGVTPVSPMIRSR